MKKFVEVAIVGLNLKPLTYEISCQVNIGELLYVMVRRTQYIGVVLSIKEELDTAMSVKIAEKLPKPIILPKQLLRLAEWMSGYYLTPIAEVFGVMLPSNINIDSVANYSGLLAITKLGMTATKVSAKQQELLNWLRQEANCLNSFASCQDAGFSKATIAACFKKGWLEQITTVKQAATKTVTLTCEQTAASTAIIKQKGFQVFLLDGITGSGKTEVYAKVIQEVLSTGKQALVLVPEIGLTQQTVNRFVERCGEPALVIHSKIGQSQKFSRWYTAYNNHANLIIGTRSALFTPMCNIGIIIIDEDHDSSFKQQNICCYSAKHAAIMLAKEFNIPIVLGSATPALESLHQATQGKYQTLKLTQKLQQQQKPEVSIFNLCGAAHEQGLALALKPAIKQTLNKSQQVLIFLNRRGYASVLFCHACGIAKKCSSCEANYIYHDTTSELRCHHCSSRRAVPDRCEECGAKSWIKAGLGTQRVEAVINSWLPDSNVLRIDRDSASNPQKFTENIEHINQQAADIIIGTQMLAKGHDFTNIGLVIILDTDAQLYSPDYKSQERLAQLLVQVAGRTGRRDFPGKIIVPTHQPQHFIFTVLLDNYHAWAKMELQQRLKYNLEPFIHSITVHIQAQKPNVLEQISKQFNQGITALPGVEIIGPIANVRPKRKGYWRYVVILQSTKRSLLNKQAIAIRQHCFNAGWHKSAQWRYDVDPLTSD